MVLNSEDGPEIKKYIQEIYKPKLKITYEIVKGRVGTAEAILKLKDKIQVNSLSLLSYC